MVFREPDIEKLSVSLTEAQFCEWQAFFQNEGWPDEIEEWYQAVQTAWICSTMAGEVDPLEVVKTLRIIKTEPERTKDELIAQIERDSALISSAKR